MLKNNLAEHGLNLEWFVTNICDNVFDKKEGYVYENIDNLDLKIEVEIYEEVDEDEEKYIISEGVVTTKGKTFSYYIHWEGDSQIKGYYIIDKSLCNFAQI